MGLDWTTLYKTFFALPSPPVPTIADRDTNPWPRVDEANVLPLSYRLWGLYYKTFYCRNLQIFVISASVWNWQAFPA